MPVRTERHVESEIIRMYTTRSQDGTWIGSKEISHRLGCTPTNVQNVLRRNGIAIRSAKESHSGGKRCKPIVNLPAAGATAPLCACACGERTLWNRSKNNWRVYIDGHYGADAAFKHADYLYEQYITLGRNLESLASEHKVTATTIARYMKQFGIERRSAIDSHIGTQVGRNNPAWKGGATPERQHLYRTREWRDLVTAAYRRDGYQCQRCHTEKVGAVKFHAHHIASWASAPSLRFDLANIVTLCDTCHRWVHSRQNTERLFIARRVESRRRSV